MLGSLVGAVAICAKFSILIACLCRAVVVVGDEQGHVGVGCASAKEVIQAVSKAVADGKRSLVTIPLTAGASFPHRVDAYFGAAKVTHCSSGQCLHSARRSSLPCAVPGPA